LLPARKNSMTCNKHQGYELTEAAFLRARQWAALICLILCRSCGVQAATLRSKRLTIQVSRRTLTKRAQRRGIPNLQHFVPACLAQRRGNEFGANVAFTERALVHQISLIPGQSRKCPQADLVRLLARQTLPCRQMPWEVAVDAAEVCNADL
jgi:hypothetical protein